MAIYGYTRVSTSEQIDGTSLKEQERRIEGIAQALGLEQPVIYSDPGVSGSVPLDLREQGGFMLDMLTAGDTLIVAKLDRAFRSAEDALTQVRKLSERQVDVVVGDIAMEPVQRNGVGKLFFTILAAVAEWERERVVERMVDGRRSKRAKGGYTGGYVPYGYTLEGEGKDAKLVPIKEEQQIREFIRNCMVDQGMSLASTAQALEEKTGDYWSRGKVNRIKTRMINEGNWE